MPFYFLMRSPAIRPEPIKRKDPGSVFLRYQGLLQNPLGKTTNFLYCFSFTFLKLGLSAAAEGQIDSSDAEFLNCLQCYASNKSTQIYFAHFYNSHAHKAKDGR